MRTIPAWLAIAGITIFCSVAAAQQTASPDLYWGDAVPDGWNGDWPAEFLTVPEKTDFTRTTSTRQLLEFINTMRWNSEHVHVFSLYTSPLRNVAPAVVLANPRVTSPAQARESGKPVIYVQGNIHPPESEGTEAMQMIMRDILLGDKKHLLDNQIIVFVPILNVDGTETVGLRSGTPHMAGSRGNAAGFDLNRDGVKLETPEVNALYRRILNTWDPVLMYDAHRMGRGNYAYANAYATSTVPAAHPGPRGYVWYELFPAVRDMVRRDYKVEVFTHATYPRGEWPPRTWSHDGAIWSVEAKFVVSNYGLRNRMSILAETPGAAGFQRQVFGQYAYIMSLLEYTNQHAAEIQQVCDDADEETVRRVAELAESRQLRNYVDGRYESRGEIDLLAFRRVPTGYLPGTSIRTTLPDAITEPPEIISGVQDLTKPVGTLDALVPRGYVIPAELGEIVAKLRAHGIRVDRLDEPIRVEGDQFVVNRMRKENRGGYAMTVLDGGFFGPSVRQFPAGTYLLDMAQPLANAAFYYLEPQSRDGFVGWSVMDDVLRDLGAEEHPIVYPIFKYFKRLD